MARLVSARSHRPRFTRHYFRVQLRVEFLEDRVVPASLLTFSANGQLFAVDPTQYSANDILVGFRSGVSAAELIGSKFAAGTDIGSELVQNSGVHDVHLNAGMSVSAALAAYQSNPLVSYAEPDFEVHLENTPNDPQFSSQWDMNNTGQNGGTPGDDIGAPAAWDVTTGSGKTVVAVIDTGVDYDHQDLYDNIWINQAEIPASRKANLVDVDGDGIISFYDLNNPINQGTGKITDVNGDGQIDAADILAPMQLGSNGQDTGRGGWAYPGNTQDGDTAHPNDFVGWNFVSNNNNPMDDNNHGTHVSGTIGAMGNNGVGIAGINWRIQIMPLKVLDASGSGTTADVISALNYSVANKATISNNSYGGDPYSQALYNAINAAAAAGDIYVAAAGNGNSLGIGQNNDTTPFYPASYNLPNVVAVAATDSNDNLAFFSNYGSNSVDLAAPGVGILSTTRNNTYSVFDGTSMATPHVTGALALVRDLHPDWTYQQVINQVLNTVDVLPSLQGMVKTGGQLDLARAVMNPPVIDLNWTGGSLTGPATADWQTPFSIARSYNITGEAAQHDFTISYYASTDTTFSDATLMGSETITAAADKTVGLHTGASPAFQITTGGTYYLFAKLDSGNNIFETNEQNNVAMAAQPVAVTGPVIIDNSQAGYSETGSGWLNWSAGYGGSLRYHPAGAGADTAVWQATGLAPGYYAIQATWNGDRSHATNAPFSIYDGTTLVQTVQVDQSVAPSGTVVGGVAFQNLSTVHLTSGSLKVVLSDNANGTVVADAVRLVPIPPPVIDLNWAGGGITGPTVTDTQSPFTINRTYNISGAAASANFNISYYASTDATFGNADDVLLGTESITAAADQSVGTHSGTSPSLQITSGGTYYLFAMVDAGNAILETDETNNVAQAPQLVTVTAPVILDNGTAAYSETGSGWLSWSAGYGGNLRYHASGTGANTANWQTNLAPGYYQVQATWNGDPNHANNAPFSIYDGSTLVQTVAVNQQVGPSGANVGGVNFQTLTTVQITSGSIRVMLSDAGNGYVVADAVRLVPLPPPVSDLNWVGGSIAGPATTNFQSTFTVNRTYNISGAAVAGNFAISYYASTDATFGNADDVLLGSEMITAAADKTVGTHSGTSPNLQITTGGTYYLFVKLDSGNAILETDETNNVAQAAQTIAVSGPVIVDNSQAAYSETGSGWLGWSAGYGGNLRYHASGTGADTANWQANLAPGYYQIQATWNGDPNHASNAPFSIYDGSSLLQTVRVNQQSAPTGTTIGGVNFQTLTTVHITNGAVRVSLSDAANGYVVADAIRLVPIPSPTTDLNWIGGSITAPAATDVQSTFTVNRTYNISGTPVTGNFVISYYASPDAIFGNTNDVLLGSETITAASGMSVGLHSGTSPNLQVTTGGTFYLFVQLDSTNAILETDETNNVGQAAQTISVSGPIIIDNSQAGYSETGSGWLSWSAGYLGNLRYHASGTGSNTANWQATGVAPGSYQIQATWNGDPNHASNAPFSIYDGTTLLQTVQVNQQPAPTGTNVGGVNFQTLTTVQISSGMVRVVLTDAGNGYVVADAVRLVPAGSGMGFVPPPASSDSGSPPAPNLSETPGGPLPPTAPAGNGSPGPNNGAGSQQAASPTRPPWASGMHGNGGLLQALASWTPADLDWRIDLILWPDPLQPAPAVRR